MSFVRVRRHVLLGLAVTPLMLRAAQASCGDANHFAREAQRMRREAVAKGDQAYGAVIVLHGCIVGYGPSRVVQDGNEEAHAERVALWNAQKHLGRTDLTGAIIYSTSTPCSICQPALAAAGVSRMFVGPVAVDKGPPDMG